MTRKAGGIDRGLAGEDGETWWEEVTLSSGRGTQMHCKKGVWGQRDRLLLHPVCRGSLRH